MKTKPIMIVVGCVAVLVGCGTTGTTYEQAVRSAVLSIVTCTNPEVLLVGDAVADVDHVAYFRETGTVAYSFEPVELGPGITGYRAELIPSGQGWSGYRHARLFELRDQQLVLVFELAGPYLFIEDPEPVNGRYRLAHWVGDDPLTAKHQTYTFRSGRYMKDPIAVAHAESGSADN